MHKRSVRGVESKATDEGFRFKAFQASVSRNRPNVASVDNWHIENQIWGGGDNATKGRKNVEHMDS